MGSDVRRYLEEQLEACALREYNNGYDDGYKDGVADAGTS